MASYTSNSGDEKTPIDERNKLFHPSRKTIGDANESVAEEAAVAVEQSSDPIPVSISQLFRFSTNKELCLDFIGLIAAAGAGAGQPLMSLIFGKLTQDFVGFAIAVNKAKSGDADAIANLNAAAAIFRKDASEGASYMVYLGLGIFACTFIYMLIWVHTGEVNAKRIREAYLRAVLRQDIAFFDNVGAGEVTTRIQNDTHLVQQGISEKFALIVNFIGAFLCGLILAYIKSWRLALALSAIFPVIGILGGLMNKFKSAYMLLSLKYTAEGGTIAEEIISTVRTAQAFGSQSTLSQLYDSRINKSQEVDLKSAAVHGGSFSVFLFVLYSSYALAFNFGTTLIAHGHATPGDVINALLAILVGAFSLALLSPEMQALSDARAAAAKLYQTIDRVPDIDSASPHGLKLDKVTGKIELEAIKFNYPSRPTVPVVNGVNLTFQAGKTAALVGASGSGKSTVISLVERFYDPTSGTVKLDGVDIKDLNLRWLRSQIGLVSQEPTLFATTIRANVAYGLINTPYENASEKEKDLLIKEACIKANADSFIGKLPLGYDTMVGERGFLLSGGQKQRVAIARAIVSDPKILLLDEATSALDTKSEGIVQDAINKAAIGRTTIVIAHRLSTIKDADTIFVMGDGVVLEQGSHDELMSLGGAYNRLVEAQKLRQGNELVEMDGEDLETIATDQVSLHKQSTRQSLVSEGLHQLQMDSSGTEADNTKDFGLFYLAKRMAHIVRDQWKNYGIGTIFACMTGAVYPCFGIIFAKGLEGFAKVDPLERRRDGDRNALWLFIIAILAAISIGIQNYLFGYAATILTARLRKLSFKSILRQDIEFFDNDRNSSGALTSQLSNNPQKVNGLAGITLGTIIQGCSTVVVGATLGIVFVWKVGLVGLACTPLVVSAGYIRLRVVVLKDSVNKKAHEESARLACEAAGAIRTVASLTREDDCLRQYSQQLEGPLRTSNRSSFWSTLLYSYTQGQVFFVIGLTFWWGAVLVSRFEATTFEFFVGLMATVFGAIQSGNIFNYVPDISSAKGAGSDIIKLMDRKVEMDAQSAEGKVIEPTSISGHVKFDNVHFRYPTRPHVRVLRDLSFEAEPGTYIALVGGSGSGKSTAIQLIERFYDPLAGGIYLDGQKLSELNIQEYRKHLALVSQEPALYAGTVRFNVLLGASKPVEQVTQAEIEKACRDANILDFIESLPQGFETEVGGKGSQLSGGQKQRIAIARALLRNPRILLLDEATSALDSNSEKVVQDALDKAAKGRTTIAIAHRLSTIQNADRIYFIKDGQVSESGTHDQLLARRGDYYEYARLQAINNRH